MGEYVKINGQSAKIGTCENLYYANFKEFYKLLMNGNLSKEPGNLEPREYIWAGAFRFRFPFPDEAPNLGDYSDYNRGVLFSIPLGLLEIAHGDTFYRTDEKVKEAPAIGFRLPCIQSDKFPVVNQKFDWNNTKGQTIFEVVQQKPVLIDDDVRLGLKTMQLQVVVRCPYCNELSRLDKKEVYNLVSFVQKNKKQFTELQIKIVIEIAKGYFYTGSKIHGEVKKQIAA